MMRSMFRDTSAPVALQIHVERIYDRERALFRTISRANWIASFVLRGSAMPFPARENPVP